MDNRKVADVYIDNENFTLRSFQRSTTDDMVARFGSAEKGQSNLDLLKAITQKSFRGGMFQKQFQDEEMVNFAKSAHYNPLDERLYFTPEMEVDYEGASMDMNGVTAWCIFNGFLYIAYSTESPSTDDNNFRKIDLATGTATSVTLPANLKDANCGITSMVAHRNAIFLCGKSASPSANTNLHRYDGTTTFTSLGTGGNGRKLVVFRDKLYIQGLSDFVAVTNEFTGTAKFTTIKNGVGVNEAGRDSVNEVLNFNGAVYILKTDGLYRFDGVEVNTVFDHRDNISTENFRLGAVFNGRMYFVTQNKLYEFDGTTVSMLQDFSDSYYIQHLAGGADRLWITARYNKTSTSIYTSGNFDEEIELENYTYALISYNGIGFFEYKTELFLSSDPKEGGYNYIVKPIAVPGLSRITWIFPDVYLNGSLEPRSSGFYYYTALLADDYNHEAVGNDRQFEIYGSEIDCGYPAVAKCLNGAMIEYDGFDDTDVTLQLYVRTKYQGVSSDWVEIWNTQNIVAGGATNDYRLHDQSTAGTPELETEPLIFEFLEYKLVGTVAADHTLTTSPRVRNLSLRYTLQPDARLRWLLTIPIVGKDHNDIDTPTLPDGTSETRHSNYMRRVLYNAYKNKKPILFYDIDFTELVYADPYWYAKGLHLLEAGDFVAIKQQDGTWYNNRLTSVVYDDANDRTRLEFSDFGRRLEIGGSEIDTWVNGSELRKSHAVYVTRIQTENIILDDMTVNNANGYSDISSALVVELVEV